MDDYNARPIPLDEGPFPISEVEQVIAQLQSLQASLPSGRGQLTQTTALDACPICFNPYLAILAEEEMAIAMDSPAHPVEYLGVTKLSRSWQCGHVFCRKE
ncbi:hypothetical protein DXG03_002911 [Asterophora parasitica]|uniref:RING-type domain-containing protein n=1 Tax=Asterophora parasitica TaxID=117018 RepID=A0A9P7G9N8_9AGAR|nr:hypothetical protein DXG03_002911 [Asterophora parasitica]